MKKIMDKFDDFLLNQKLIENVALSDKESEIIVLTTIKNRYNKLYYNQVLMNNVVEDTLFESIEDVALSINTNNWDKDPLAFYQSFTSSFLKEYLTPYTIDEIKKFDLYKVAGYNIGFAIKDDGNIILVHNNDKIKGIGNLLMKKAIQYGGKKIDHFDGFLTGFYLKNGFIFKDNDPFLMEYCPDKWNFNPVDINNPKTSIYVNELKVNKNELNIAKVRYDEGMPDIVYRTI